MRSLQSREGGSPGHTTHTESVVDMTSEPTADFRVTFLSLLPRGLQCRFDSDRALHQTSGCLFQPRHVWDHTCRTVERSPRPPSERIRSKKPFQRKEFDAPLPSLRMRHRWTHLTLKILNTKCASTASHLFFGSFDLVLRCKLANACHFLRWQCR